MPTSLISTEHFSIALMQFITSLFAMLSPPVAGRPLNLDGVTTHGNTDVGILRDAFARAGIPEDYWRPRLPQICEQMCLQVEQNKAGLCATVLPQAREVLLHLRNKGATLSVATGNLERIGRQKLTAANLLELFTWVPGLILLSSRADILCHAIEQVRRATSADAAILAVGDTPADIRAARANHLPVMAVATGIYTFEQLQARTLLSAFIASPSCLRYPLHHPFELLRPMIRRMLSEHPFARPSRSVRAVPRACR